jgi:hypothetical protein
LAQAELQGAQRFEIVDIGDFVRHVLYYASPQACVGAASRYDAVETNDGTDMLERLFRTSYGLLLFKRGPQDMPASDTLTLSLGLIYLLANFLLLRFQGASGVLSIVQALVDLGILVGFTWAVLRQKHFGARLGQTLSALLVTGLIFGLLSIAPVHSLAPYMKTIAHGGHIPAPPAGTTVAYLSLMVLVVWSLAVTAHILRHALEVRVWASVALTLFYQILSFLIMVLLFGGRAAG